MALGSLYLLSRFPYRRPRSGPDSRRSFQFSNPLKTTRIPKYAGFTLVEIMIVVALIALLATISIPNYVRARKRSQAALILQDLRALDTAVDQYAIESNKATGAPYVWTALLPYLKIGSRL